MPVIRHTETRRTETPNAVMTTLASPTQGAATLAMWRVEVDPGAAGPLHTIDTDQIWTVVDGTITVDLDGTELTASVGDTVVMPADLWRRISGGDTGFTAVVSAAAGALARTETGAEPILPPWIA
ncbi:cupin domain-containing protein [Nocardia bovistercoris]|uniref:Cupin domain-containing protein n=1 Tax=Nocardia bovistercoris TaxID=2785916 RepID=A0A931IHG5_9NOCA|nr:cupin domain-containing protein [Nocardia bovistercoris]MBH0781857.1 cupin domain-containing protein [Nocardia bovistercoris]